MATTQTLTMLRVKSGVPALALFRPPRRNAVRVRILRRGEWVDITNRVRRGTITESNDQAMMTLDLELLNGAGFPSLAPRRADSEINLVDGEYDPLLWPDRQIVIEAATSTDGSTPEAWVPVFHGVLGDDIDSVSQPHTVQIYCRDLAAKLLMDDHIVGPVTYENKYASQIIQQILIDRHAVGGVPMVVPFRAIGEDDHWIERYTIENQTAWQAIQNIVDQSGWDVRWKLDESDHTFKLTYWLPSTDMDDVDWIIESGDVRAETLKISDVQRRNRVEIAFRDANGVKREVVATTGETPIRLCRIEEGDTSTIQDEAAAQRFADRVLSYLKDLHATDQLDLPFNPYIGLFDVIENRASRVRSMPERYAVDSRTLEFSADSWKLTLVASGSVGVRPQRWIDKETRPGVKRPWEPGDSTTNQPMPTPTGVSAEGIPGGIRVTFDEPNTQRWAETRVYVSTTSPVDVFGTPAARAKQIPIEVTGLTPGQQYYVQLVHLDAYGNRSLPSNEITAIPEPIMETPDLTPPAKVTGMRAIPDLRGFILLWDRHTPPPPLDRYELQVSMRATDQEEWSSWQSVADEIRSVIYTHKDLLYGHQYRYRVRAISRAGIAGDWSDPYVAGEPGRVSLASDIVDKLARGALADDVVQDLDAIVQIQSDLDDLSGDVSVIAQRADEISQTVARIDDDLGDVQSEIQQHATAISQRVVAKDENGNPITTGEIRLSMVDGKTYILLDADQTIIGTLRVTGPDGLTIESEDGHTKMVGNRIELRDASNRLLGVIGDVHGLPWGAGTLPQEWAAWFAKGGIYLAEYPRVIKAGQVKSGEVFLPGMNVVPEGKVWIVHFTPVGSVVPTIYGPSEENMVLANVSRIMEPLYDGELSAQVFGLDHTTNGGSPPIHGMFLPPGEWENVKLYAYSVSAEVGLQAIDYWGTYIVLEVDSEGFL